MSTSTSQLTATIAPTDRKVKGHVYEYYIARLYQDGKSGKSRTYFRTPEGLEMAERWIAEQGALLRPCDDSKGQTDDLSPADLERIKLRAKMTANAFLVKIDQSRPPTLQMVLDRLIEAEEYDSALKVAQLCMDAHIDLGDDDDDN